MKDPTSAIFQNIQQLMRSGAMVGQDRPVGRITWAKGNLLHVASSKPGVGQVRYLDKSVPEEELLGIHTINIERSVGNDAQTCTFTMFNVRPDWAPPEGVDTSGSLGYLTPGRGERRPKGVSVYNNQSGNDYGLAYPKYLTQWQYSSNKYRDVLIPNTVIRTYQGYGSDNFDAHGNERDPLDPDYLPPQEDGKLYMTGVWLIDKVTFTADGDVTVECRDLGKLLIEQYIYPPMIPMNRFPLIYKPATHDSGHKESIGRNVATFHSSSVDKKYGHNHSIKGHRGSDAFDGNMHSFWLSGPDASHSDIEWLQAKVHGEINEVVLHLPYGHQQVWICVHENGRWQGSAHVSGETETGNTNEENLSAGDGNGSGGYFYVIAPGDTLWDLAGTYYGDNTLWPIIAKANNNIIKDPHWIYPGQKIKIPYVAGTLSPPPAGGTGTAGTHVEIPYVAHATVPKSGNVTVKLPRTYKAGYVRVVFGNLTHISDGSYRAGCREMIVRKHIYPTFKKGTLGKAGYISDWYEPVKELCAWAGLAWINPPYAADPLFSKTKKGSQWKDDSGTIRTDSKPIRAWGDFEFLGAGPVVATPAEYFMAKSFMEGIRQIADFIGAMFYIDESGGAQFRLPNIWSGGNFIDDPDALSLSARIKNHPIEFHENANLVSYSMVISDEALRSEILVIGGQSSVHAKAPVAGGYVLGYNRATGTTSAIDFSNVLAGQYRLMVAPGDATKLFYTAKECQRMAELTALMILFTYRTGNLTAPAHPGLQIDDQIKIYERVTNESYIHYVSSIQTNMDLESGEYTMNLTTHWLGDDPNKQWFTKKQVLTPEVLSLPALVNRIGNYGDDINDPGTAPFGT